MLSFKGNFATSNPAMPVGASNINSTISTNSFNSANKRKLWVNCHNDEDSDPLPYELDVADFGQLRDNLAEICCPREVEDKNIVVILEGRERILALDKIIEGGSYSVSFKIKPSTVKFYLVKL